MVDSVSGVSQLQQLQSTSRASRSEGQRGSDNVSGSSEINDSVEISSEALSLSQVEGAQRDAVQVRDLLVEDPNATLGRIDASFDELL